VKLVRNEQPAPESLSKAIWTLAASLPPGTAVPVPSDWLMQQLGAIGPSSATAPPATGRLLTADEAATRLGMTKQTLYRNAKRFPFTVHVGRRALRFDENKLNHWLARHTGARAA
jgi:predicted DNA-binding transcriptional regulator AlpA